LTLFVEKVNTVYPLGKYVPWEGRERRGRGEGREREREGGGDMTRNGG